MKDAIDKRNEREKIAKSVVKRRNIVYITQEELERKQQEEAKQQEREAAAKLAKQLREDENKKKAMEIERLLAEQKMLEKQLKTGMDATGKHPMDDITQERVEAILSEKSKKLQDIIAASSLELAQKNEQMEVSVPEENPGNDAGTEANAAEIDVSGEEADTGKAVSDMQMDQEESVPLEEAVHPEDMGTGEAAEMDVPAAGETDEIQMQEMLAAGEGMPKMEDTGEGEAEG